MDRITGIYWDGLRPALYTEQHTQDGIPLAPGDNLTLNLSKERHCIGYYDEQSKMRSMCPDGRKIALGKQSQCGRCQHRSNSFTAKTGKAIGDNASELLDKEHTVYLAFFGKDCVKVGVARLQRDTMRVLEQGAFASLFIAHGDGSTARLLERSVHNKVQFTEAVRMATKLENLVAVPTESGAKERLFGAFTLIKDRIDSPLFRAKPEFHYLYPTYGIELPPLLSSIEYIRSLDPEARISGTIVGVLGRCVLIHNSKRNKVYALESGYAEGFKANIELATRSVENISGVGTQTINFNCQGMLF